MRKNMLILSLALMLLTACEANNPTTDGPGITQAFPQIIEPHNPEQAEQSGDVVVLHGGMRNGDTWNTFMKNVKKKQQDQVRVTMYTIEGGAIIQELIYDGSAIQSTYDNSRDAYGSKHGVKTDTCKGIGMMKSEEGNVFYVLTGCEKEENPFMMPKL
ncbi:MULTISPECIES: DUF4362 domain-containing protein [Paenibacillus]|uniref:DUF4362 domain-containing protein n=1 Tax=Paenibacillus TaxID=44249 RepID=UPI000B83DE69|nr:MULTISPECIES: DUF4362 domain-containing protein [Paenibacillus]PRA02811.1 DUF4362 domain-containing protein [Paenibacillus sp. MYb63]PRA45618.1 DUF4362 domain-containing protein [Paenibacillus sp. MYb67]